MSDGLKSNGDWVAVQKRVFTKWANHRMKRRDLPSIDDVEVGFEDGTLLIGLLSALYPSIPIPKYQKKCKVVAHKLDNLSVAWSMMETQKLKISCKQQDIIDHNLKMILGLLWTLILDHSVTEIDFGLKGKAGLLQWCKERTAGYQGLWEPDGEPKNFGSQFSDGRVLCALIDSYRPELINYESCLGRSATDNISKALRVAEDELGVPDIVDVGDIDTPSPIEQIVIAYVAELYHALTLQERQEEAAKLIRKFMLKRRKDVAFVTEHERRCQSFYAAAASCLVTAKADAPPTAVATNLLPELCKRWFDIVSQLDCHNARMEAKKEAPYLPDGEFAVCSIKKKLTETTAASSMYSLLIRECVEPIFSFEMKECTPDLATKAHKAEAPKQLFAAFEQGMLTMLESLLTSFSADFVREMLAQDAQAAEENEPPITAKDMMKAFECLAFGRHDINSRQLRHSVFSSDDLDYLLSSMSSFSKGDDEFDYVGFINAEFK